MDEIDRKILSALKENGRASVSEISKQVALSIPAVAERIKKMEQSKVIERYMVKVDRRALGCNLMAFILVNIDRTENIEAFRRRIIREKCVLECHHVAGPYDYLLKVAVRDTDELETFLSSVLKKIKGVHSSNTLIRLSTLKEEINL